jgi:UDP-N-acetylglucosamine 2-epimerase (non-hydrolysing)
MKIKQKINIACIVGTRPEIIKMAPVIFKLKTSSWARPVLINTAQHRGLLDDMLETFKLIPDFDFNIMLENQTLANLASNLCIKLDDFFNTHKFQAILAVGDTTTVLFSALIAFYHKIPFGHIEAGLRTFNNYQPFPEEMNRLLEAPLATWHFAPTKNEKNNLIHEHINKDSIFVTGNTVIDALYWILKHKKEKLLPMSLIPRRIIVVTAHRRENQGKSLINICKAILILSHRFTNIDFILPVHPNPNVKQVIEKYLGNQKNISLISPLKYDAFVHLMQRSTLMLTDSGGIQEEASALHKPVVIMRNYTERSAVIQKGLGLLVGTQTKSIVTAVSELLTNAQVYQKMVGKSSPYGNGHAAEYIVEVLKKSLKS